MIQTQEFEVPSRSRQGKTHTVRAAIMPDGTLTNWYCPCEAWQWNGNCFHVDTAQTMQMLQEYADLAEIRCGQCSSTAIAGTPWGEFRCLICNSRARVQ